MSRKSCSSLANVDHFSIFSACSVVVASDELSSVLCFFQLIFYFACVLF